MRGLTGLPSSQSLPPGTSENVSNETSNQAASESEKNESYTSLEDEHMSGSDSSGSHTSKSPVIIKRGSWSPQEDAVLMQLINSTYPLKWVTVASAMRTRTSKQCRERYHNYLKPSLSRGPITEEEAEKIKKFVALHGKKWAVISRQLPGRSDNAIKNWWNASVNRKRNNARSNVREVVHKDKTGNPEPVSMNSTIRVPLNVSSPMMPVYDSEKSASLQQQSPLRPPPLQQPQLLQQSPLAPSEIQQPQMQSQMQPQMQPQTSQQMQPQMQPSQMQPQMATQVISQPQSQQTAAGGGSPTVPGPISDPNVTPQVYSGQFMSQGPSIPQQQTTMQESDMSLLPPSLQQQPFTHQTSHSPSSHLNPVSHPGLQSNVPNIVDPDSTIAPFSTVHVPPPVKIMFRSVYAEQPPTAQPVPQEDAMLGSQQIPQNQYSFESPRRLSAFQDLHLGTHDFFSPNFTFGKNSRSNSLAFDSLQFKGGSSGNQTVPGNLQDPDEVSQSLVDPFDEQAMLCSRLRQNSMMRRASLDQTAKDATSLSRYSICGTSSSERNQDIKVNEMSRNLSIHNLIHH